MEAKKMSYGCTDMPTATRCASSHDRPLFPLCTQRHDTHQHSHNTHTPKTTTTSSPTQNTNKTDHGDDVVGADLTFDGPFASAKSKAFVVHAIDHVMVAPADGPAVKRIAAAASRVRRRER